MDGFRKRGIIYFTIAALGIFYEVFFSNRVRVEVVLLWLGVAGIGVIVMLTLKDEHKKTK